MAATPERHALTSDRDAELRAAEARVSEAAMAVALYGPHSPNAQDRQLERDYQSAADALDTLKRRRTQDHDR